MMIRSLSFGHGFAALFLILSATLTLASETSDRSDDMRKLGRCAGCVLEGRAFEGQSLTGVDLSDATLTRVDFDGAQLNLAIFEDAVLSEVSFAGATLRGASFVGARLSDVSFDGADLRGAVFEGAVLERTSLDAALLCNTQTPVDKMDNSDCSGRSR